MSPNSNASPLAPFRSEAADLRVGVVGLGLIGSYVALRLAAEGVQVRGLGRRELSPDALSRRVAENLAGRRYEARAPLEYTTDPAQLGDCGVVLLATKSAATGAVSESLVSRLDASIPILSLQNGLNNPRVMHEAGLHAFGGVVSFNVHQREVAGRQVYAQTTSGPLLIAEHSYGAPSRPLPATVASTLASSGLDVRLVGEFEPVARAKLLLNLNNGVCAATGLTVAESIRNRDTRRVFATCIREGLSLFHARGEKVRRIGPLSPALIASFLPRPDAVVKVLARPMIQIDPNARSSTLVDLEAGRLTEIDELNAAIVQGADKIGLPCPANRAVVEAIRALEKDAVAGRPLGHLTPAQLLERSGA